METKEIELKRGYSCSVKDESEDTKRIDYIGNYSKSDFNQTPIVGKNGIAPTVTENHGQVTAIEKNLRIRKLTPYECMVLMGFDRIDYLRIKYKNCGTIEECNAFDELEKKFINRTMNKTEWKKYRNDFLKQQLQTDSQIYHEAGDSIVVDTLYHMYMEMK